MEAKDPFKLLIDEFRAVVREEIQAALNGQKKEAGRDWLTSVELAQLYPLPRTWFEERGREGVIARSKPGRYVLFNRRDVERYLEKQKSGGE